MTILNKRLNLLYASYMKLKALLVFSILVGIFALAYGLTKSYQNSDVEGILGSSSSGQGTTTFFGEGYGYKLVRTNVGTFGAYIYKANLSKVTVKTVAANKDDCKNNCPTKPLAQYVKENNAIAGMNGSYFCPPDYTNCKSKTNSYDFALYNSNQKKWLNKKSLSWFKTAMATFKGRSPKFCMDTTKCGTGGVTAAISNYPALVHDGKIVVDKGDVQPYQRRKGMKGAVATDGTNIYLMLIPNTTITEAAYVARAVGATFALNIDGGGSSALYANGRYMIGPGRSLPNAIVLVK